MSTQPAIWVWQKCRLALVDKRPAPVIGDRRDNFAASSYFCRCFLSS